MNAFTMLVATMRRMLEDELPSSRERSLAITRLEECEMWAVKASERMPSTRMAMDVDRDFEAEAGRANTPMNTGCSP